MNLDGSGSVFPESGEDLRERLAALDIHPTGSLWGDGAPLGSGEAARIELSAVHDHSELCDGLQAMRIDAASRALRLSVRQLEWEIDSSAIHVRFELGRGSYATAVLREIAAVANAQGDSSNT